METGYYASVLRSGEGDTPLGPLERTNLNHSIVIIDFLGFRESQLILFKCIIFYSYYIPTTYFGLYILVFS
jgi:hypothetical protein